MRFARQRKRAQFQFNIRFLFALTSISAVLVWTLKWLFLHHLSVMPMLALFPPLIATSLLLCATKNEIWKGVLVGGVVGICFALFLNDYKAALFWRMDLLKQNNAIRLTFDLCQIWIFFQVAACPFVGGCIEAIRKRYVSLGIYALW